MFRRFTNNAAPGIRGRAHVLLACVMLGLGAAPVSAQCVMCRESLKAGSSDLVSGFLWSTLLMTTVPVALLSIFGVFMYRSAKRQSLLESAIGEDAPADPVPHS